MSLYLLVLWPFFGAIAVYWIPRLKGLQKRSDSVRDTFVLICTAAEVMLVAFLMTEDMAAAFSSFGGFGLGFRFSSFSALYCLIAAFTWLMVTLLSREYIAHLIDPGRYYFCFLLTLSAVIGIFMAADFFTLFMFFEMMSLVSFPLVAHDGEPASLRAAGTYLRVSVIGGLFIIAGMLILYKQIGSLTYYTVLTFAPYTNQQMLLTAGVFMLIGFGAVAGIYPLHTWLPGVYLAAPTPVSVLMSGILTKCGILGIITVTVYMLHGNGIWSYILIFLGTATMIWGAVCALLSSDLRKIFVFSSMSQTGFILIGAGVFASGASVTAAAGLILQMVNNSLIMTVLFGSAGVIYINMHSFELSDIRGFGHGKPLLNAIFLSGALGIGGIPMWNGYISNVLLHESIIEIGSPLLETLFLFAGGLTIAYMAKVYIVIFVDRRSVFAEPKTIYMDMYSRTALVITAALLPLVGILPNTIAINIVNYSTKKLRAERLGLIYYFSGEMLLGAFISLLIGVAIYIVFIRRRDTKNLIPARFDLEERLYLPLLRILIAVSGNVCRVFDRIQDLLVRAGIFVCSFCLPKSKKQRRADDGTAHITTSRTIAGNFSAGLLITCTGLCAVLACLIINEFI